MQQILQLVTNPLSPWLVRGGALVRSMDSSSKVMNSSYNHMDSERLWSSAKLNCVTAPPNFKHTGCTVMLTVINSMRVPTQQKRMIWHDSLPRRDPRSLEAQQINQKKLIQKPQSGLSCWPSKSGPKPAISGHGLEPKKELEA